MKRIFGFGLLLLGLVTLTPDKALAGGNGCYASYNSTGSYSYSDYSYPQYVDRIVPVAYPVPFQIAVPVVSYLQNSTYAPTYAAQPAAAYGQPQYAQAQPQYQQQPPSQPQARAVPPGAFTDEMIDALVDRILQRLDARASKSAPPVQPEVKEPPPVVPKEKAVDGGPFDAVSRLRESCASCHSGTKAKGGVQIFLADAKFNQRISKQKLYDAIYKCRMPKDATGKVDDEALWSDDDTHALGVAWGLAK